MVILKVDRTSIRGMENIVMVNSNVVELKPFCEITITKSNGDRCQFRLIMNSSVPMGYLLIGDMESRVCRLHLGHKYHVEGVTASMIAESKPIIDFSQLKLAGYSSTIEQIVRRAFRPRKLPLDTLTNLEVQFVRGVILYGPPGTGKTTIIKGICEYFNLKPKIINGPELLNPLIGKSEEAVRVLFEEAYKDQRSKGDSSPLHVFVFEEMDALFAKRTSADGGSDTRNGVVNQLLTMMDGYEALNNILIFGTTNRLDKIDSALLRGGRFEMQIKFDLPTVQERLEMFNFYLNKPRKNGFLASDISAANLQQLVSATNNYNGADIAQIVRLAKNIAIIRIFKDTILDLTKLNFKEHANIRVKWNDLITAFNQCEKMRRKREIEVETKENNAKDNSTVDN